MAAAPWLEWGRVGIQTPTQVVGRAIAEINPAAVIAGSAHHLLTSPSADWLGVELLAVTRLGYARAAELERAMS